ncbi:hypothetical protein [Paragemmobacter straminiformis]|uniref:Uncharacterized protein n=1 Tax=Paragemmobacter straminiformis TaxID=2045119 RepID=A0A842I3L8_9RHOB|nr:hypothetical protein [Gemmobacter straminiformis]
MIRPEVLQALNRWREVIASGGVALAGLWIAWQGGYVLLPFGLCVIALAAALALQALRRLRFAQAPATPGVVEVDEAQIAYLSPDGGGFVGLPDLVEIRLLTLRGKRFWRLRQADGQALLVPVDAMGADQLFDAFAALPNMDSAALLAALETKASGNALPALDGMSHPVWHRPGAGLARR